jgi:hypothetical protein
MVDIRYISGSIYTVATSDAQCPPQPAVLSGTVSNIYVDRSHSNTQRFDGAATTATTATNPPEVSPTRTSTGGVKAIAAANGMPRRQSKSWAVCASILPQTCHGVDESGSKSRGTAMLRQESGGLRL